MNRQRAAPLLQQCAQLSILGNHSCHMGVKEANDHTHVSRAIFSRIREI